MAVQDKHIQTEDLLDVLGMEFLEKRAIENGFKML